jgi:hypothetical protein
MRCLGARAFFGPASGRAHRRLSRACDGLALTCPRHATVPPLPGSAGYAAQWHAPERSGGVLLAATGLGR